ncbi:hypothetical protein GTO91_09885 [Heliobacterium undosum]|uniref:Nitroreductase domain-containing protein n=1 Tax=Heliomicrobium undosum TaxID=121734 RepID=A0A845L589_9FIRM|nr:nitroreductase family protein [Heliomicrobium undosum]MZP30014.1 hypothetical protein [Heliomicrobium undosum]
MNSALSVIKHRRSTRSFKEDPIQEEALGAIIEAGMYAPSAANQQPWHFTVVQNKQIMNKINQDAKAFFAKSEHPHFKRFATSPDFHVFHNAPCAVFISGDTRAMLPHVDCAAATQNMLLAAESLGVGSCWTQSVIHLFEGETGERWIRQMEIPEHYRPLYAIVLGYKMKENQTAPERKANPVYYIQ